MALPYLTQLQPWEENQSPSPTDEIANPYEVALIRSRSTGRSRSPPSPVIPFQTLQRQLSGDTDNPPPPWTRRPSVKSNRSPSTASRKSGLDSVSSSAPPVPSISQTQLAPPSRRHPGLTMTASDSPSESSTSLSNDDLGLPNPAFRRRPGSNRSSMTQSSLTSEELWALEQQANGPPDLSNPMRQAAERPLDTIKRMSRQVERQYSGALPGDVIWPSAPPIEEVYVPPIKSRSSTNIVSLNKRGGRRRTSRQTSLDMTRPPLPEGAKSMPTSPKDYTTSSARSSSTSLASQNIKPHPMMNRAPPVTYYSRDFMTSLAPREGGYAIAAQLASTVSSPSDDFSRYPISRASSRHAPAAPSTGMGRWSLDGGENFIKPYGTPSAATTSSSISGGQTQSPEDSPPAEMHSTPPLLPNGASPAQLDTSSSVTSPATSVPVVPSPLKVSTASLEPPAVAPTESKEPTPTATKSSGMLSVLGLRKSTRSLAKSSRDAEKAEAAKAAQQRVASATEAAAKKAEREAQMKAEREAKIKADAEAAAKEEARKKDLADKEAARKVEMAAKEEARRKELAAAEVKRKEQTAAEEARKKEIAAQEEAKRKEQLVQAEIKRKEQLAQAEVKRKEQLAQAEARRKEQAALAETKRKEQAERDAARQKEAAAKRKEAAEKEAAKKKEKEQKKAEGKGSFFRLRAPSSIALGQTKGQPPRSSSQVPPAREVPPVPSSPRPTAATQPFPKLTDQPIKPPADLAPTPPRQTHTSLPLNALSRDPAPPPKPTPESPQRSVSQRGVPPPRQRTSMFGTLKKRFSMLTGTESRSVSSSSRATPRNSPSPSTSKPTPPTRAPPPIPVDTPTKITMPVGPPTPAKELPPVPASPVQVTVISADTAETPSKPLASGVEPLRDLPPRTTSHTPPRTDFARLPGLSPQQYPSPATPPTFQRSSSHGTAPVTTSSPLTKTLSQDSGARSVTSQSDSLRRRSSVKGPRPMPHSSPETKHVAQVAPHSDPLPSFPKLSAQQSLPDGASPPQVSHFPLAPAVDTTGSRGSYGSSSAQADVVTPSTPGESDMSNSHSNSTGMDLVSPSFADDDRIVILDNSSSEGMPVEVVREKVPVRESSDETIQADIHAPRVISVQ